MKRMMFVFSIGVAAFIFLMTPLQSIYAQPQERE